MTLISPACTNWRDKQRVRGETATFFRQGHNMPELFLTGSGELLLLEYHGINTFANISQPRPAGRRNTLMPERVTASYI